MVIELKKGKATKDFPLQLMRYVDWISREYAAGDYSLIKAVGIAKGYPKGMQKILDEQCKEVICQIYILIQPLNGTI